MRAHAALAAAEPHDVHPPDLVRTLDGRVHAAAGCVVLDAPWLAGVLPDDRVVSAGDDFELAEPLAELLDLPLATEDSEDTVDSPGERVGWTDLGAVVAACELTGIDLPPGTLVVHDTLIVSHTRVPWWVDGAGTVHVEDSADALARALAWVTDSWPDRHALAVLINDPEPRSFLA
jgi:hypothetical protein